MAIAKKQGSYPSPKRLYNVTQVGGGELVLVAPPTSRVTMFGGGGTGNAVVRIYLGNRLIGFFPNVVEFYEIGQVAQMPSVLGQSKSELEPGVYRFEQQFIARDNRKGIK